MSAAVLLDENLPRALGEVFRAAGYSVVDIQDVGMRGASDDDIFRAARGRAAILATRDLGFANIRRYPPGRHGGIIVFRIPHTPREKLLLEETHDVLEELTPADIQGSTVIVEPGRSRIRRPSTT